MATALSPTPATAVATGWLLGGTLGIVTVAYALAIGPLVHQLLPRLSVALPPAQAAPGAATGRGRGTPGPPAGTSAPHPDTGPAPDPAR